MEDALLECLKFSHHRRMLLEESGIDPSVVAGRGYRTVKTKAELAGLGFSDKQRRAPALVVPMYSPAGELVTHQIRPDAPREGDGGKAIKYETPTGSPIRLDVHPSQTERIRNASVPLWITEGVKKADSLVSRGQCAMALQGVWCWQKDGVPLRDWEDVRLWGRSVGVIFDSDVTTNLKVQAALEGLLGFLRGRGARVIVAYLPDAPGGGKQGVDDFLVDSAIADKDFLRAMEPSFPSPVWLKFLATIGVTRLPYTLGGVTDERAAISTHAKDNYELANYISSMEKSYEEVRAAPMSLEDKPLIVLSAGSRGKMFPQFSQKGSDRFNEAWTESQADLTRLSRNSEQIIAKESGHNIQYDDPGLVIDATRQVVEAVRNGGSV